MKTLIKVLKKFFYRAARSGFGLPMALSMMIICSALIGFIFYASAQFMVTSTLQQETYMSHMRATDYVEMVKGMISDYNMKIGQSSLVTGAGKKALQSDAVSGDNRYKGRVTTSKDLQILRIPSIPGEKPPANPNLDLDVPLRESKQAVRVKVFDVAYTLKDLASQYHEGGDLNNKLSTAGLTAAQLENLSDLPPPLVLLNIASEDSGSKGKQQSHRPKDGLDTSEPLYGVQLTTLNLDQIGAYVVHVELFDTSVTPRRRIRLVEEAFFQIISIDLS